MSSLISHPTAGEMPNADNFLKKFYNLEPAYANLDFNPKKVQKLLDESRALYLELMPYFVGLAAGGDVATATAAVNVGPKTYSLWLAWLRLSFAIPQLAGALKTQSPVLNMLMQNFTTVVSNSRSSLKNPELDVLRKYIRGGDGGGGSAGAPVDAGTLLQYRRPALVTFGDIVGMEEIKERIGGLLRVRRVLKDTEYGRLLLYGPPGTGKTMFAEAIANFLTYTYIPLSNSDIASPVYGESERILDRIFTAANGQEAGGVFILFDEIDSITGRGKGAGELKQAVTAFLLQVINHRLSSRIFLCATTNFPGNLDAALVRRLSPPAVAVPLPSTEIIGALMRRHGRLTELMGSKMQRRMAAAMCANLYSHANVASFMREIIHRIVVWSTDTGDYEIGNVYPLASLRDADTVVSQCCYRIPGPSASSVRRTAEQLFAENDNVVVGYKDSVVTAMLAKFADETQQTITPSSKETVARTLSFS